MNHCTFFCESLESTFTCLADLHQKWAHLFILYDNFDFISPFFKERGKNRNNSEKCIQNAVKMPSKMHSKCSNIPVKCSQNSVKIQSKCTQNALKIQSKFRKNSVKIWSKFSCNRFGSILVKF